MRITYGRAIRAGFQHLLSRYPEVFVMGQGLWSPWYVGDSMTELEVEFGRERVLDSPVSEQACTGAAVGAAIAGKRPIVVHPRMDFMILAVDQIVTQAAKWSSMFAGRSRAPVVVRGIINRGGEQGAQHSQALHAWFAHVPGLRVVMPATVADARDLLVSATLCDDPVLYVDDRWLYALEDEISDEPDEDAIFDGPRTLREGDDATVVAAGYSTRLALEAADLLAQEGVSAEVVDLRQINPLDVGPVVTSVRRTRRLVVVDGGWTTCGLAGEVIASVAERLEPGVLLAAPRRVTLQDAPAPTSGPLEAAYYPTGADVAEAVRAAVGAL
ncbi:MAG: alpha-ketoacid dehydrogenase subunit beta [Gemmatimonadetes bacterium]|nr:MAG: alpha-ketoacid dehydrogenase subunit beta [Gemmatimonadota bacterium]